MNRVFRMMVGGVVSLVTAAACIGGDDERSSPTRIAQRDTGTIDSIPVCDACSLVVVDSVAIGTTKDSIIPVRVPGFLRDSRGRVYLKFEGWSNRQVIAYDSSGKYVAQVGQYGQGPGEYRHTQRVFLDSHDSLYVFEHSILGHVFSPEMKYVRRANAAQKLPFGVSSDSGGHLLATNFASWPPRVGALKVFRIDKHASLVDSFALFSVETGQSRTLSTGKESYTRTVRLESDPFPGPGGAIWTLGATNYRLELHDRSGASRKLFGVLVSGEPPPIMNAADMQRAVAENRFVATEAGVFSPKFRRSIRLHRWLDVDSAGLLWIGRQIPAPGWDTINPKPQFLSPNEAPKEATIPREIEDRRYHTVIEVIDPNAGVILARIALPFLGERVSAGFVGRVTADDDGFYKPTVYRLQLRRSRP